MVLMADEFIREDSQIDFATGNVFCTFGGGGGRGGGGGVGVLQKKVSQILAIIDFFKQRNYRKKPCQQGRILQVK